MKGHWKKLFCLLSAFLMAAGMTACTSSPESGASTPSGGASGTQIPPDGEEGPVTLIFLTSGAGLNEEEHSATVQAAAEKTGVFVQTNIIADDKWSVMMASGSIDGDILSPQTVNQQQLVEGGLIRPLDDLLEQYGQNIQKAAANGLPYWKEYKSFGQNQIFFIPSHNSPDMQVVYDSVPYNYGVGPYIRWDYYKELGSPKVANEDDFLAVLKQMQDKHPTNDTGKKTYPMSLEVASSPLWCYGTFYSYYNDREFISGYECSRGSDNELKENALQDDFIMWSAAEYYNKAYRMGILDPETFTQKGENVKEKITTGQAFYTENSWNDYNQVLGETVGPEAGFEPLLEAWPTAYAGGESRFGWSFTSSITSSCQYPEKAMQWLDYLYSEEGSRLFYSGIEGQHWNYVDGVPTLTDETVQKYQDTVWNKENGLRKFHNMLGINNMVPASDGYAVDLFNTPEMLIKNNKPIDDAYCKDYGVDYPGEVGKKIEKEKDGYKVVWWDGAPGAFMPPMPDDMKRIQTQTQDIMIKGMPKLIMAGTPEEFAKERTALIQQLQDAGIQQVIDWVETEYTSSKAKDDALR